MVKLFKALPSYRYVVFIDNFFTKKALFFYFKLLGFNTYKTAKIGSGIPLI